MIPLDAHVWVTGHRGLVGSALVRRLESLGYTEILTVARDQLDLRDQRAVTRWIAANEPQYVIHAAGTVGGVLANSQYPADFLYDNLLIHATVLRAAFECRVEKLLYLGSSCIYPRDCPQPIREEYLLSGPLEETNCAYAIAKICGLMSCRAYRRQHGCRFISAMPTNLYGPNDNYHPERSHVVPGLIRRFHEARQCRDSTVVVWGSGRPRREFMHVDDLASAALFLLESYDDESAINVGTGSDVSIRELAETIRDIVYPEAKLQFDTTKPDGTPRKLLDVSRLHALGWRHTISLREGLGHAYDWFSRQCSA